MRITKRKKNGRITKRIKNGGNENSYRRSLQSKGYKKTMNLHFRLLKRAGIQFETPSI